MKHSRQPTAQHQHRLAGLDVGPTLPAVDAGQRLGHRGLVEGNSVGYRNGAAVNVDGGKADVLAEAAGVVVGGAQGVAYGVAPAEAVAAGVAGYVVGHHQPVAFAELGHVPSYLSHCTGHLVAQHHRGALDAIPLHDVAAADAAGFNLEQQLAGADFGHRHLLDANVVVVVIHRYAHGCPPLPLVSEIPTLSVSRTRPPARRYQRGPNRRFPWPRRRSRCRGRCGGGRESWARGGGSARCCGQG